MLSVFVLITTQVGTELSGVLDGLGLLEVRVGRAKSYAGRPLMNLAACRTLEAEYSRHRQIRTDPDPGVPPFAPLH
jgi:hypothetical protein